MNTTDTTPLPATADDAASDARPDETGIDWDAWRRDIGPLVEAAAGRTDRRLAGELARVTRLSEAEIGAMFPDAADAERLGELMSVVKSSAERHERVNALVTDARRFGDVTLALLERLA